MDVCSMKGIALAPMVALGPRAEGPEGLAKDDDENCRESARVPRQRRKAATHTRLPSARPKSGLRRATS
eukprot:6122465-Pyramimonas_sp.AAC.1